MRLATLAASLLAAAQLISPASADTKTVLREMTTLNDTRGWEGVGRLNLGGSGFCTGALIAPDLVLTAAHCLFDKTTGERIDGTTIEFLAGWRNGRAEAYRSVRRAATHPDYNYAETDAVGRVAADLALLELDKPIRNNRVLPFAIAAQPRQGKAVGVVSYAQERSEAPSIQEACEVLERHGGVAMLNCDVNYGSSGAPVFAIIGGQPHIVSVVSAKAAVEGRKVALSSELQRSLHQLKMALADVESGILNRGLASGGTFTNGDRKSSLGAKFIRPNSN
ncbi:trypsin-like serine protease [Alphaproteobacteria bacterium KMM 3653]|uniref:Trypsin-like serine protease n=1 Tax=Harenicola maris TaxID=2841044 RepID=A0AAP2GAD8_9RHOB|nr:trypsin-like serine protease [Harenicola maris]